MYAYFGVSSSAWLNLQSIPTLQKDTIWKSQRLGKSREWRSTANRMAQSFPRSNPFREAWKSPDGRPLALFLEPRPSVRAYNSACRPGSRSLSHQA